MVKRDWSKFKSISDKDYIRKKISNARGQRRSQEHFDTLRELPGKFPEYNDYIFAVNTVTEARDAYISAMKQIKEKGEADLSNAYNKIKNIKDNNTKKYLFDKSDESLPFLKAGVGFAYNLVRKMYQNKDKMKNSDYQKDIGSMIDLGKNLEKMIEEIEEKQFNSNSTKISVIIAIAGLLIAGISFSNGFTGNAISNVTNSTISTGIGILGFVTALCGIFLYVKNNKK